MRLLLMISIGLLAGACDTQGLSPQDENLVNATLADPGVVTNENGNFTQGSITPGEREAIRDIENQTPEQVVANYAALLEQRKFDEAFALWDPGAAGITREQFARQFADYKTIDAEVGDVAPPEGAAGSIYDDVQLTLTGDKKDGSPYTVTGPVTLRRVNDVPGSTAEQRRWRIVKTVLTADPRAAESLVGQ
jgi:hypothetical protein